MDVSTANNDLHRFNLSRGEVGLNYFVDDHEAPHALIQETEFLKEYAEAYWQGANFVGDFDKDK